MLKLIVLFFVILLIAVPFVYMFVDIILDILKRTKPYVTILLSKF